MIPTHTDTKYFSNYIDIVAYEGEYAVYNKINGALVLLEPGCVYLDDEKRWECVTKDEKILQYLEGNLFFTNEEDIQRQIVLANIPQKDYNDIRLVISLTEICNCACAYCYQLDWNHGDALSTDKYKEWILDYISNIARNADTNAHITIKYFGGEPLLKADFMFELNREIKEIIDRENKHMTVTYEIDSNCTLLTREILLGFDNLSVATTLSLPEDHDTLRSKTFRRVLRNLQNVADLFELPQYRLNIEYNAHHGNIADFPEFLRLLKSLKIKCSVFVVNIVNYKGTNFVNQLDDEAFEKIYCKSIIPALVENGFPVDILPRYGIKRACDGMNTLNRKFYTNGTQTLCSFFPKKQEKEMSDYPERIKARTYLDPLPEKCIKCFDFPYCGGERPCIKCNGSYALRGAMQDRIKLYLDLQREENLCTDT